MGLNRPKSIFDSNEFRYFEDVEFHVFSFKEYIKITKQTIDSELKQKIEEFHEILKESSEFEIEYRNGWDFAEQEIRIYTLNLYSNSLFISLYSFLERKLYQICKVAEKNKSIKINDLSGDGIFKYCNYLKTVSYTHLTLPTNREV